MGQAPHGHGTKFQTTTPVSRGGPEFRGYAPTSFCPADRLAYRLCKRPSVDGVELPFTTVRWLAWKIGASSALCFLLLQERRLTLRLTAWQMRSNRMANAVGVNLLRRS